MGIAESMKGLCDDILTSYDIRAKALADLVAQTHRLVADARKTINSFTSDREKMSKEQGENLANGAKDLTRNIGGLLKTFEKNRKQMNHEQAKIFEEQTKDLAEFAKALSKDIDAKLKDVNNQRSQMSEELKTTLNKTIKDIHTTVKNLVNGTQTLIGGYRSDMDEARAAWQSMSSNLAKFRQEGSNSEDEEIIAGEGTEKKKRKKGGVKK